MQFYISVMFLGLPDNIQEEKPSFFNFENNWLPTDGPTDRRTDRPSYRDARTHLKTINPVAPRHISDNWGILILLEFVGAVYISFPWACKFKENNFT